MAQPHARPGDAAPDASGGLTRRQLLARSGAGAAVLALAGAGAAAMLRARGGAGSGHAAPRPDFVAYLGAAGAEHARQVATLAATGYRPISLAVYDDPARPLYAAVWVRRAGPAWAAFAGVDAAGYRRLLDERTAQGWAPGLVAATGTADGATFAGTFERVPDWGGLVGLDLEEGDAADAATYAHWSAAARARGLAPRWAAIYGAAARPLYAAVWGPSGANLTWSDDYRGTDAATLATLVEQHGRQAARPALVTLAADGRLWALFVDDAIGPWTLRVGMTAAQYEAELAAQVARGSYPIRLQAGGIGAGARFAAIFARGDAPLARAFTVATPSAGGPLDGLDAAMEAALRELNAHGAALAIARQGRLVFARGYSWAAPGYPQRMRANGTFRIASCSKLVTAIAIHRLLSAGRLTPETRAQDVLNLRGVTGDPPADSRWGAITISQLLTHTGGWDAGRSGDPIFDDATVLAAFPGARYPVTRAQIAAYMASRPLDFDPGTARAYSNFGYVLLGMVVDRLAGDYEGYVRGQILAPLGIRTARLGRSRYEERDAAREALYDEADVLWVSPSVVQADQPPVAEPYGTYNHENLYAAGAWVFSAPALLKLLAAEYGGARNPLRVGGDPGALASAMALGGWDTVQAVEGGVIEAGKVGLLPGTVAALTHRSDDVSVCLFFSMWRLADGGAPAQAPQRVRDALARMGGRDAPWPAVDLFPALLE